MNSTARRVPRITGLPANTSEPRTSPGGRNRHNPLETMARLTGLEPVALGLEGRCSIHLSYRRANQFDYPTWAGVLQNDGGWLFRSFHPFRPF